MKKNKLCIGTAQWGMPYGISNFRGQTKIKEVSKILSLACLENIKYLDTANSYGDAEKVLGSHELSYFSIITKIPKFKKNNFIKSDKGKIINLLKQSLKKLNCNSCYGLLLHHEDDLFKKGSEYLIEALNYLKSNGLINKFGISIYNTRNIDEILKKLKPDIVQLPLNIFDQRALNNGTLKYLKENKIETHSRSVFLQGLLLMSISKIPKYFEPWFNEIINWKKMCEEKDISCLDAALNFVVKQKSVDYCIIGVENLIQLKQCLTAIKSQKKLNVNDFSNNDIKLINPNYWKI